MSYEELDRVSVIERVIEKRLTQREAARMLGLTSRQVRRLRRAYERDGPRGLASKHRGRPSNRRLPSELRREALETVRSQYEGFGPTLAHEKLTELHGMRLSVETLRHWMTEDGLWLPRAGREPRIQQPRRRRPCRGELIQIDGSDHEWFEERAPRCTLLVFVDDATSALMELRFCESESAFSYFEAMRSYLGQHGKPVTLYSDKATVFRVNKKEPQGGTGVTQFGRALSSLNIDILCANTPAAKGRVERAHLTLQDRLVKELRLRDFSAIQPAEFTVFVWFGMWSLLLAALILIDGEGRTLLAWPFAFSSMVLGPSMVLLYLAFRGDARAPPAVRSRLAELASSRWVGVVIAALCLGALWDGRAGDLGQLWTRFQTDYFTHAMLVDEAIFAVLVPVFVAEDVRRTGRPRGWIWASGLIPILGACAYLATRGAARPASTPSDAARAIGLP